jgi:hypothetical protein
MNVSRLLIEKNRADRHFDALSNRLLAKGTSTKTHITASKKLLYLIFRQVDELGVSQVRKHQKSKL